MYVCIYVCIYSCTHSVLRAKSMASGEPSRPHLQRFDQDFPWPGKSQGPNARVIFHYSSGRASFIGDTVDFQRHPVSSAGGCERNVPRNPAALIADAPPVVSRRRKRAFLKCT